MGNQRMRPSRPPTLTVPIIALGFAMGVLVTTEFIVVGLMPLLAETYAVSLKQTGLLISAFALSASVLGPLLTLLLSRHPHGRAIAFSLLVFGAGSLLAATVPSFPLLLAVRLLQGALLTAVIGVASAAISSMAGPGRAGYAIGQMDLGLIAGLVFAMPAATALANQVGWPPISGLLGVLALIAGVLVLAAVPVDVASEIPARQTGILFRPDFMLHLLLSALLFMAMFSTYSYIAPLLEQFLGLPADLVAPALMAFGLVGIAGHWAAMRLVDRAPLAVTIGISVTLGVVGLLLPLAANSGVLALPLLAVWGIAHMAGFIACQARVIHAAPDAAAFAASLNISACNAGIAAGALAGVWMNAEGDTGMNVLAMRAQSKPVRVAVEGM
ncbi:MAG: MFS transporter, partial [Ectothiorhodospiraceae bacterium]|nr:MFS transporter [Ectothiorhodospiraceae bacterium]